MSIKLEKLKEINKSIIMKIKYYETQIFIENIKDTSLITLNDTKKL